MAKVRSIMKLSGTMDEMTFVDSVAYGAHSRAKRGSKTPISLADGMKVSSANQNEANVRAKIIFDAINEFAPGFKDGKFWSRLISIFRKQKKAQKAYSYTDFRDMEMRYDYSTSKQGLFSVDRAGFSIYLKYDLKADTGYQFSMLRIATDPTLLVPFPKEILETIVQVGESNGIVEFDFTPLPEGSAFLYVLQCEQLYNGQLVRGLKGRSVRLL